MKKPAAKLIHIVVKPGSKMPGISEEHGTLTLRVKERAVEGAANEGCIRALATYYQVAPSTITLVRGARAKNKTFRLS